MSSGGKIRGRVGAGAAGGSPRVGEVGAENLGGSDQQWEVLRATLLANLSEVHTRGGDQGQHHTRRRGANVVNNAAKASRCGSVSQRRWPSMYIAAW